VRYCPKERPKSPKETPELGALLLDLYCIERKTPKNRHDYRHAVPDNKRARVAFSSCRLPTCADAGTHA
jgi:hypothetical protein